MNSNTLRLAFFFCQNVPGSGAEERKALEKEYGGALKLFPLACSGRVEYIHLLKALEEFADAAYLATCPEGACRYFEGNHRARKRIEKAREIIQSIGLEGERVGIVTPEATDRKDLAALVRETYASVLALGPSPVLTSVAS